MPMSIKGQPTTMMQMIDRFKDMSGTNAETLKKDMKYIYLPIPQSVSDSLAVSYAEDTLNPLQALGLDNCRKGNIRSWSID